MFLFVGWILLAALVAMVGSDRKIGYWGTFIVSLLLSPVLGLIIGLASDRKPAQAQPTTSAPASRIEELERLGKLRADGLLTSEEYEAEKRRILEGSESGPKAEAPPPPPGPYSGGTVSDIPMR